LLRFLGLGFPPANLRGVDIIADRIQEARARLPGVRFDVADATALPFADASFDVVFESTMFVQITDETMATKIAAEMLRVTRPGGHVMLIDWRYSKPGNSNYLGVSPRRIRRLFDLPARGDLVHTSRGSLIPPVGRFLSKYLPALYFPVSAVLPFMAGQTTSLIRKAEI
jgi:ubiquinone/menaquinone biosynthesis C-methylase UbiE